jgi:hypothetical protein
MDRYDSLSWRLFCNLLLLLADLPPPLGISSPGCQPGYATATRVHPLHTLSRVFVRVIDAKSVRVSRIRSELKSLKNYQGCSSQLKSSWKLSESVSKYFQLIPMSMPGYRNSYPINPGMCPCLTFNLFCKVKPGHNAYFRFKMSGSFICSVYKAHLWSF